MTGCIFKRKLPSGKISWGYCIDAGRDDNGKRKQIFKTGFARKLDADIELARLVNDRNEGSLVRPDPRTFGEFSEAWLAEYAEISCAPKTAERYREMLAHVTRSIGPQTLSKVTTLQLQRVYNKLLKEGKKDGTPLSIKTVRNVHGAVHIALETGVTWGLLRVNPASRCKLPPAPKREAVALDFAAARKLLECSSEHWLADFLAVDIACGARRGEMLALAWPDIDFEAGVLTISKSLEQTKAGLRLKETKGRNIRRVTLPQDAIDALQRVKAAQDEARQLCGPGYRADLDLVFCHPDGNYIRPDTVTKAVRRIAERAGFTGVSLHTLRHSHGSELLNEGVPLPAVSKRLGHSNMYVTATVYAHALPSDESHAAAKWEAAMKRAGNSKLVEMPLRTERSVSVKHTSTGS
jgi:integrase